MVGRAIALELITREEAGEEVCGAIGKFIGIYRAI
jgi:hypothetical protein